jgi:hypothetical protein
VSTPPPNRSHQPDRMCLSRRGLAATPTLISHVSPFIGGVEGDRSSSGSTTGQSSHDNPKSGVPVGRRPRSSPSTFRCSGDDVGECCAWEKMRLPQLIELGNNRRLGRRYRRFDIGHLPDRICIETAADGDNECRSEESAITQRSPRTPETEYMTWVPFIAVVHRMCLPPRPVLSP